MDDWNLNGGESLGVVMGDVLACLGNNMIAWKNEGDLGPIHGAD